jgi:hypothetical protein
LWIKRSPRIDRIDITAQDRTFVVTSDKSKPFIEKISP